MEYLTYLFRSGLGPSAIKGHWSAVGPIFKSLDWFDPSKNCLLTLLVRRFCLDRLRTSHGMPRWDLGLILGSFLKYPYVESTSSTDLFIDLKWLTVKTVFTPRQILPKGYCRWLRLSVCPSVRPSVRLSVRLSVRRTSLSAR